MKLKKMHVIKDVLFIEWDNKTNSSIEIPILRKHCPCAVCTSQPDGSDEMRVSRFTEKQFLIESVSPVGNYAVNIVWKDGHNTGIYEFRYLKKLPQNQAV